VEGLHPNKTVGSYPVALLRQLSRGRKRKASGTASVRRGSSPFAKREKVAAACCEFPTYTKVLLVTLDLIMSSALDLCSPSASFFGFMGCASSIIFASQSLSLTTKYFANNIAIPDLGSCYGTAKAGVGVCAMGVLHPQLVMKSTIPTIMAGLFWLVPIHADVILLGILGIYGLIVAVLLSASSLYLR